MDQLSTIVTIVASIVTTVSVVATAFVWLRRSAAAESQRDQRMLALTEALQARVDGVEAAAKASHELVCEVRTWVHELREWRAAEVQANRLVEHRLHRLEDEQRAIAHRAARVGNQPHPG